MDDTVDLDHRMADDGSAGENLGQSPSMSFDFTARGEEFDSTNVTNASNQDAPTEEIADSDREQDKDFEDGASSPGPNEQIHSREITNDGDSDSGELSKPQSKTSWEPGSTESGGQEAEVTEATLEGETRAIRIEIPLPSLPEHIRQEYEYTTSDVIERIKSEEFTDAGQLCYRIEYTDGREDLVSGLFFSSKGLFATQLVIRRALLGNASGVACALPNHYLSGFTLSTHRLLKFAVPHSILTFVMCISPHTKTLQLRFDPLNQFPTQFPYSLTLSRICRTPTRRIYSDQRIIRFTCLHLFSAQLQFDEVGNHPFGQAALEDFYDQDESKAGKRKRAQMDAQEYWDEFDDVVVKDSTAERTSDEDSEPVAKRARTIRDFSRQAAPSRRRTSQQGARNPASSSDGDGASSAVKDTQPRRSLRARRPTQIHFADDKDELQDDRDNSFDPDAQTLVIQSDLPGPRRGRRKLRRLKPRPSLAQVSKRTSPDSDIEFEAPRRSGRATRNQNAPRYDEQLDEELLYRADDNSPAEAKVVSVKEVFQAVSPETDFASVHIDSCHSCGHSKRTGQLVYCQGCSLTFHRNCIGPRSAREHMVTKVGANDFVLQCKWCIGRYRIKDSKAPQYNICQDCHGVGKACKAFSEKKTSRQEEKIREQNDGVDPVTPVSPDLLNNHEVVLFRCVKCHRGWHIEHLPPTGGETVATDVRSERLQDYSIDWQCNDCSSMKHNIDGLVAWRPAQELSAASSSQSGEPGLSDLDEDSKEYLIKWESTSYFHCTWKPGAWVWGVAKAMTRKSFAKKDAEKNLMRLTKKEAIPDEYLMPDVILNLKVDKSIPRLKSKEDELKHISHIRKIYVKFQGLGYDEAVWDSPPRESDGKDIYNAFLEAFYDYLEGQYFESEPSSRIRDRIQEYKRSPYQDTDQQPAGLQKGKLMAYQIEGLNWLLKNFHDGRSVVLADEMGLGKTVQVVSLVCSLVRDSPKVSYSEALESLLCPLTLTSSAGPF